ncbi:hypothetical protein H1R20_g16359, partial [Candolleomyces eurysporus]
MSLVLAAVNMLSLLVLADAGLKYLLGQMLLHLRTYAHKEMLDESGSNGAPGSRIPLRVIQFRHPQPVDERVDYR